MVTISFHNSFITQFRINPVQEDGVFSGKEYSF